MFSTRLIAAIVACLIFPSASIQANPAEDRQKIRATYQQLFPQLTLDDYAAGGYSIDPDAKASWQAIEEFPPYEIALEQGEILFKRPFANGSSYADCFTNKGIAIAQNYPFWDTQKQQITTLASAINESRLNNQLPPLAYGKGEISELLAYMAYTSRGQRIKTRIPADQPEALAAYNQGKAYFYQRRGQLNFSCATCHLENAGKFIRSEILSPALGHTTHWPAYRLNT